MRAKFKWLPKANKNHQTPGQTLDWNFSDPKFRQLRKAFIY